MIDFIQTTNAEIGARALAGEIISALKEEKRVLWLVPGGSNIPISVEAMNDVRKYVSLNDFSHLTIALTDERYGPIGHVDSNWKQLQDVGFDFKGVNKIPVLIGKSLEETVSTYEKSIDKAMGDILEEKGVIIGQFGMGADGHIAGILPHSVAATATATDRKKDGALVCGYEAGPFIRVTLTPVAVKKVSIAYIFAFGNAKEAAVTRLRNEEVSIDIQPAQILKSIEKAHFYADM